MRKATSLFYVIILSVASLFSYSVTAKTEKVALCHNLGNGEYILIVVSEKAAASHIAQHDDHELRGLACGLLID